MSNSNDESQNFRGDFDARFVPTNKIIGRIIRVLIREVNKHKLDHGSLRYIYRQVRERCELTVQRKPKKLYQLPTQTDVEKFFSVIEDPVHQLLFEVLLGTGLREAELCNLRVEKINFQNNTVFITGKGNKDRMILISDRLKEKIKLYLSNRNNRYLFESIRGTKFSTRRIQQICAEYKELTGIDKSLSPHTFRHIFNTRLAEAGVSKEYRALLSGHSSDRSQEIYTHLGIAGIAPEILKTLEQLGL